MLDVLALRATYGERIVYLCGNHELPHIYGFGLARGEIEYPPGFEAALSRSSQRSAVLSLFRSLPFYLRTAAGVSLAHAGAADSTRKAQQALNVFTWRHQDQLSEADAFLAGEDVVGLRQAYARLNQATSYDALARHYLAVSGENDPRYDDLLRGFVATMNADFRRMRSALFTKCEREYGTTTYATLLTALLKHLSVAYVPQRVLVAGHMIIPDGHEVVAGRHLRLASGCHARPPEAGLYLLFDAARPVQGIGDLLPGLHNVYGTA